MTDIKISEFPDAVGALSGNEYMPILQGGVNKKATLSQFTIEVAGLGTMSVQDSDAVAITGGTITGITALGVAAGGTGTGVAPTNGQLLIGNGTDYTRATLTAGTGIVITNAAGAITIDATGTVSSVAALTLGTAGNDLSSTVANSTTTPVITLNVPTASAANRGALSSTDWTTFNSKQAALVSGTNIKTVSGTTLLGAGDLGTIGAGYGGTGIASYTVGDLLYASGATALSALAGVATGNALISGGVGVAPSWGKIGLTTHVSGTLAVGNGGTGLTGGTSGGVLYFSGASTLASSAALTANAIVLGGGAGSAPASLGSLGTTTTVLHGNAGGAPTFAAVSLTADVSGTLPVANGGTGSATQNFVDLSNTQSAIAGAKTFTTQLIGKGTATNDSAAAGYIGEYIESIVLVGSAVSLTTGTEANVTSISLTAGDWDVSGLAVYSGGAGASATALAQWGSSTSATFPTPPAGGVSFLRATVSLASTSNNAFPIGIHRVSVSGTTTYYLSVLATFSGGTLAAYGTIHARRVR